VQSSFLVGLGTPFPHLFFSTTPWVSSSYTWIVLFLAFVHYEQNRRLKILNREAKIHRFIVFNSSIWGTWKFFVGLSPSKSPLWRRNWLPTDIYFKNCITKLCKIHQNESNTFFKLFMLKWLFLWLQMLLVSKPLNKGDSWLFVCERSAAVLPTMHKTSSNYTKHPAAGTWNMTKCKCLN